MQACCWRYDWGRRCEILLLRFKDAFVISSNYSVCGIMSLKPQFHKHTQTEQAIQNNSSMKKRSKFSKYHSEKILINERKRGKKIISPQMEDSPNLLEKQFLLNLRMTTQHKILWKNRVLD